MGTPGSNGVKRVRIKSRFFICNEALSILENAAEFINIPQQLKDVLLQLRDKNAAKAEEKEESEE